ncbi:YihY/virulence factor BrkB family protein [Robbsia sp. Bb-Pol-6]|uniref:YihY/virulence factor BrkB family protein n=1 Tax=Robbsia betulipollinis TaxID=2981849 RepID=A0ABT3ZLS8_9BURK|nr:YihY/virulence factor BrkB family protein [Robbsia betulipollinis]MCY0387489.1 YihY/virulence factor BrkB family protein [Robbsia betulipollinis]
MTTVDTHAITEELKREGSLAVTAIKRFSSDQCTTLAASIAFYSAFSLAPMLLMVIAVAGWFFGAEAAQGQLFSRVHDFLGNDAAAAIQAIVQNAHRQSGGGLAAVTSLALLFIGASATFSSLNTALDVVFPALPKEKRSGIALMVRVRLVSFGLVLGVAFLLVVSLVLDTVVTFIGKMVWGDSPFVIVGDIVQLVVSLSILSLAFTALMKLLPDASIRWRDALVGGIVSSVLFTIGKKLFALYLAHAGTASAFGAAGSLAVLLMWLYFSSAVLLLGAEFAAVKGGFGVRKDATAAAVAAAGGAPAPGNGGKQNAPETAAAAETPRPAGGLAAMVPSLLRQSTASRLDDTSGRRADVHADRTGRARARPRVAGPAREPASGMDLLDALISRTKHPVALRMAVRSAPLLLRGVSLLMPKKKPRAPARTASLFARLMPFAKSEAGLKGAKGAKGMKAIRAAAQEAAALGAAREADRLAKAKAKARGRHPLTAALFAAGAGLIVASIANRDAKSDAGPLGKR